MKKFLQDILPFFHHKHLIYVDVGAYTGATFEAVLGSGLQVREAHLIEPNPDAFARLQERVTEGTGETTASLHNVAVGAGNGRVTMRAAGTMSKVVAADVAQNPGAAGSDFFEAPVTTLDALSDGFLRKHISLLKIDAEGFEEQILEGAQDLLAHEAIDMIYAEAGLDPANNQQTYYRRIEDRLAAHGYRMFRIYEQTHEWPEDSPLLRRVNLAFMSRKFALANPQRMTRELFEAERRIGEAQAAGEKLEAALIEARTEREAAESELTAALAAAEKIRAELLRAAGKQTEGEERRLAQVLDDISGQAAALRDELAQMSHSNNILEKRWTDNRDARRRLQKELEEAAASHSGVAAALEAAEARLQLAEARNDELDAERRRELDAGARERDALRRDAAEAEARAAGAAAEHAQAMAALARKAETLESENRRAADRVAVLMQERSALSRYADQVESRYLAVLGSATWKALDPLRWVLRRIKALFTGRYFPPNRLPQRPKLSGGSSPSGPEAALSNSGGAKRRGAGRLGGMNRRVENAAKKTILRLAEATGKPLTPASKAKLRKAARALLPGLESSAELKLMTDNLWGGYSGAALGDLRTLAGNAGAAPHARAGAAYALAQWHYALRELDTALDWAAAIWKIDGAPIDDTFIAIRFDCLIALGRFEEAHDFLFSMRRKPENNSQDALRLANSLFRRGERESDGRRLGILNGLYERAGLTGLALRDPSQGLRFDNLRLAAANRTASRSGPTVSVIMPVFDAEEMLPVALRSLQEQTWADLEIIVVDDCSRDATVAVAEGIARSDPRIRVVRQEINQGAYAARNKGLTLATGAFITTHDADDWSHPQKIEFQVDDLLKHGPDAANVSFWARATADLLFTGTLRPSRNLIVWNHSSFMAPRAVFERIGGWDFTRVAGDTEFIWRFERVFGKEARREIGRGMPLSFALDRPESLTRTSLTHAFTMYHGVRREYREAARHWHAAVPLSDLFVDPAGGTRAFPAPSLLTAKAPPSLELDYLFIMDFSLHGGSFVSTFNYVQAAVAEGKRVGVLHWARYDLGATRVIKPQLRDLAQEGRLRIVAPGESVTAGTVIVGYPPILEHRLDRAPSISFENFVVVVNQMAFRLHGNRDPQYDPLNVRRNMEAMFGTGGRWAAISGLVKRLMEADGRYPPAEPQIWTPLIDTQTWCAEPLAWRGSDRAQPVIGRHGRDHYTKWPTSPEALRAAYCADKPCEVRLLGGAVHALDKMRGQPSNWVVHQFGSVDVRAFLADLDFYIHYPHEDYIEEFGRAVLEAMAVGVPAVLPPVFRETFGDAASYAEPDEVWPTVERIWKSRDSYLEHAERGRRFVLDNSDWNEFPKRIRALQGFRAGADRAAAAEPERFMETVN